MKVVIHIGLPKSASSSLQIGLSRCSDLVFLGLYPTKNIAENLQPESVGSMRVPYLQDPRIKAFYLNFSRKAYSKSEQSGLYQAIRSDYMDEGKILFFSYEGFTSPMFSEVAPDIKLQRLVECALDAEFVFIARNQEGVIKSQYRDWPFDLTIKNGRSLGLNEWCQNELQRRDGMGPLLWFDYEKLLNVLPSERTHVLLFEDYVAHRELFCAQLAIPLGSEPSVIKDCLDGVQSNRGVSARYNAYRKFRRLMPFSCSFRSILPNWLLNSVFGFLNRGGTESLEMSVEVRGTLREHFSNSNRETIKKFNLATEGKGYWL